MIASDLSTQIIAGGVVAAFSVPFGLVGVLIGARLARANTNESADVTFRREQDVRERQETRADITAIREDVGALREQVAGIDAVLGYVLPGPRAAGGPHRQ